MFEAERGAVKQQLIERFRSRSARVAVIGLGYVGLPLAVRFAEVGYEVVGIDLDKNKIDSLRRRVSYIEDVSSDAIAALTNFTATDDFGVLAGCQGVSICVPTPLNKTGDPDMTFVAAAADAVAAHIHPGLAVVLESTTYPGTTTELLLPLLQASGQQVGRDFFLAFSPERVDPGRTDWTTRNTPKVFGGVTPDCTEVVNAFYGQAIETLVPVSSPEAAEMVKLYENTFRSVNIGLANELQLMCDKLGLDAWEVLEAAATKPFGFMKFTPGPGLGGHCIPIDPLYLSWKLRTLQYHARFIELASEINTEMPRYWVQKVQDLLNENRLAVKGSRILVLGVAYKKDVSDVRESPALDIMHLLAAKGAVVEYHDPHVPSVEHEGVHMESVPDLSAALAAADVVVVVTNHSAYQWAEIEDIARLLIDTRGVLGRKARAPQPAPAPVA